MKFIVKPKKYHKGYCKTICKTLESAGNEKAYFERFTDFEWVIEEY